MRKYLDKLNGKIDSLIAALQDAEKIV